MQCKVRVDFRLITALYMHSVLSYLQAFEKGFKPKGTVFPCGYEVHANIDETMAERLKNLAKVMGKCGGSYKLSRRTFLLWCQGRANNYSAVVRAFASLQYVHVFDSQN